MQGVHEEQATFSSIVPGAPLLQQPSMPSPLNYQSQADLQQIQIPAGDGHASVSDASLYTAATSSRPYWSVDKIYDKAVHKKLNALPSPEFQ